MFKYLNIRRAVAWFATHKREAVFLSLAILISTASFAAGYLLARDGNEAPIIIQQG